MTELRRFVTLHGNLGTGWLIVTAVVLLGEVFASQSPMDPPETRMTFVLTVNEEELGAVRGSGIHSSDFGSKKRPAGIFPSTVQELCGPGCFTLDARRATVTANRPRAKRPTQVIQLNASGTVVGKFQLESAWPSEIRTKPRFGAASTVVELELTCVHLKKIQ